MFSPGTVNYLKLKLFGAGEYYDMSCMKSDACLHKYAYVKEIYNREDIPIDYSNIKIGAVPVATEYLTLSCTDCSKSWNGKRTILENIEIKVGRGTIGATGRLPKMFTEIKVSDCDHSTFNIRSDTIEYIDSENYCDELYTGEHPQVLLWAFCQAECRYCKCKLYVKRNYVKGTINKLPVDEFTDDSKWEKCKIILR